MKKDSIRKSKRKGFTLVEVIIVLAIIAIIAAIAIPNLTKVRTESKKKADTQSIETLERTVNMLVTDETLEFDGKTPVVVKLDFTGAKDSISIGVDGAVASDDVISYFKDIKKPQVEGGAIYQITVNNSGVSGEVQDKEGTKIELEK